MYIEIKTERLLLRPLCIADAETTHAYAGNPENTVYMTMLPNESKEETVDFLKNVETEWAKESPDYFEFAIMLGGYQIGAISIYLNNDRTEGMFGWILNKAYQGKGYAHEAAEALKTYAVKELGLKSLCATCDSENERSYKLMEKLGMKRVCSDMKRHYIKSGKESTGYKYAIEFPGRE